MAISHICHQCGWDLTRSRAVREPVYGLPLVSCPKCGERAVRRRHPLIQRYRGGCRAAKSVVVVLFQLAIAAGLMALTVAFLVGCAFGWNLGVPGPEPGVFWTQVVVSGALLAIATGLWLTVGFRHHGIARAAIGWLIAVMVAYVVTAITIGLFGGLADLTDKPFAVRDALHWVGPAMSFFVPPGFVVVVAIIAMALTMYPVGRVILRMHAIGRRAAWRWMRRRRRVRFAS